jgi:prophage antirepressor-like protein
MEIIRAFNENDMHTNISIIEYNGEPHFRASDIGEILGLSNIRVTVQDFDDTEKIHITKEKGGGNQSVLYLTEFGLYNVLFVSRKPIAKQFKKWVCEVIKQIRIDGLYVLNQKNEELQNTLIESGVELQNQKDENERIRLENCKVPTIYIYNTDTTSSEPLLKIGMTDKMHTRFKPYKQTHPHGKCIFHKEISGDINLRNLESFIHNKLEIFHVKGENYRMDVEEAKICVLNTIYDLELYQINNTVERQLKGKKIFDATHAIINDIKISTSDSSTQTEFNEEVPLSKPLIERDMTLQSKFDEFIESHCIVRSDVEVSSKQIVGAYRLYAREAKREVTQAFTDYLNRKFKPDRLKVQNMDQIVMGFSGVMLKPVKYEKQITLTDHENFIFNNFEFTPDGTVLWSTIVKEFKNWKRLMKEGYSDIEENLLKKYLKQSQYLLFETVWASGGSGQGYYGLKSKSEINQHRTSSTACKIQKKDINNNVLCEFETIAKIASIEKISPATMSRSIKNKVIFEGIGGSYFYEKKK